MSQHYKSTISAAAIRPYKNIWPELMHGAYVDSSAQIIGNVVLGVDSSVWPMVVIRGDVNKVRIGNRSNIQDGSVIHESRPSNSNPDGHPTLVGEDVTVGHKVVLHGCTIGNRVLVGIGAIVLDGAVIEDDVIIGAGAMVTPGKRLESGFLYTGSPARKSRPLRKEELAYLRIVANNYVELKNDYSSDS